MKAILLLLTGVGAGALGVWYWARNAGKVPALEALGDRGQQLNEQSQQLHKSLAGSAESAVAEVTQSVRD